MSPMAKCRGPDILKYLLLLMNLSISEKIMYRELIVHIALSRTVDEVKVSSDVIVTIPSAIQLALKF